MIYSNPAEGASFPNYYLGSSGPSREIGDALIVLWKGRRDRGHLPHLDGCDEGMQRNEGTESELKPSTVNLALEVLLELVSIPNRGRSLVQWCREYREKCSECPPR